MTDLPTSNGNNVDNRILLNQAKISRILLTVEEPKDEENSTYRPHNFDILSITPVVDDISKVDVVLRLDRLSMFSEDVIKDSKVDDETRYRVYKHRLQLINIVDHLSDLVKSDKFGISKTGQTYMLDGDEVEDPSLLARQMEFLLGAGPLVAMKLSDNLYNVAAVKPNLKCYGSFNCSFGTQEIAKYDIADNLTINIDKENVAHYHIPKSSGHTVVVKTNGFDGDVLETFKVDNDNYLVDGTKTIPNRNVFVIVYDKDNTEVSKAKLTPTRENDESKTY